MNLDIYTSLFFTALAYAIGLVSLLVLQPRYNKVFKSFNQFFWFYFLSFVGLTLIVFREDLTSFFSITVANTLILTGRFVLISAFLTFFNKKSLLKPYLIFLIPFLIVFSYFTYSDPQLGARIIIFNAVELVLNLYLLVLIFRQTNNHLYKLNFIILIFTGYVLISLSRIITSILNYQENASFFDFNIDAFNIIVTGSLALLLLTGILFLATLVYQSTLKECEKRLLEAQSISKVGSWELNLATQKIWGSEVAFEIYELPRETEFLDLTLIQSMTDRADIAHVDQALYDLIGEGKPYDILFRLNTLNGKVKYIESKASLSYNSNGNPVKVIGVFRDITELKKQELELLHTSYHDYLTGLYNRRFMEEEMKRIDIKRNLPISIIMGDLNGLKLTNDALGHSFGDELLKLTATVFRTVLRGDEIVARLGGDEFMILLPQTSSEIAASIITRIQNEVEKQLAITKGTFSISLGMATKTDISENLDKKLIEAENEMYKDKIYHRPSLRRKSIDAILQTLFEKDEISEIHSRNVAIYSTILARKAGLEEVQIRKIETAALLHDIGKIIIQDNILQSTNSLTNDEYEEMKKHPDIGFRILSSVDDLSDAAKIILNHHERIDGNGYPNGLKDKEIPIESKIISICDAYDAMIGDRHYKKTLSHEKVVEEFNNNKGTQFDLELTNIFINEILNEKKA